MEGELKPLLREKTFYIALALVVISTIYWMAYSSNALATYHEYGDLGLSLYNMYIDINHPNVILGVQWLVFANHIAIDQFISLAVFLVSESAMTLLVLQDVVLCFTALVLYLITRDMLKSNALALAFAIAFLLNPGIHGMLIFDYHAEDFIVPLYILTFYFFMKGKKLPFYVSTALLLGTIEEAPFLAITLGVALFLYAYFTPKVEDPALAKQRTWRVNQSVFLVIASIVVLAVYGVILTYLTHAYCYSGQTTACYPLAPQLRLLPFLSQQVGGLTAYNATVSSSYTTPIGAANLVYAFIIVGLSFGVAVIFDFGILILLQLSWIGEVILLDNTRFIYIFSQHYAYALGGTIVAALLGILMLREKRGKVAKWLAEKRPALYQRFLKPTFMIALLAIIVAFLLVLEPTFLSTSGHIDNLTQSFLFQVDAQQQANFTQLTSVVDQLPPNASLATQDFIFPHVFNRPLIEIIDNASYIYFLNPKYILVDFNTHVSRYAFEDNQYQIFYDLAKENYSGQSNYTLIAYNGLAHLYECTNPKWCDT